MTDLPAQLQSLGLRPHPEGGHYRETFRSAQLTTIDFLLLEGQFSAWHRVSGADEVWNHHRGGRLGLHILTDDGRYERIVLGDDRFSAVVPADAWQAAEALDPSWVLVGCTVAPPFAFDRFTMADASLPARFPDVPGLARFLR